MVVSAVVFPWVWGSWVEGSWNGGFGPGFFRISNCPPPPPPLEHIVPGFFFRISNCTPLEHFLWSHYISLYNVPGILRGCGMVKRWGALKHSGHAPWNTPLYPPLSACTLYIHRPTCSSICPSDINYLVYIYTLYICLNDTTRGKIYAKFGKPGLHAWRITNTDSGDPQFGGLTKAACGHMYTAVQGARCNRLKCPRLDCPPAC